MQAEYCICGKGMIISGDMFEYGNIAGCGIEDIDTSPVCSHPYFLFEFGHAQYDVTAQTGIQDRRAVHYTIHTNVETRYHIVSKLATGNTANEPQEFRDNPISFPIRERQRRNHHRLPTKNMAVNLQQWRQVFLRPGKIDSQLYHSKLPFEQ